jgi:hypothetical protein
VTPPFSSINNLFSLFIVPDRPDFPMEEEKVLDYWKQIDAF